MIVPAVLVFLDITLALLLAMTLQWQHYNTTITNIVLLTTSQPTSQMVSPNLANMTIKIKPMTNETIHSCDIPTHYIRVLSVYCTSAHLI